MIYLDYASTTPIDEEVLQTYVRIEKDFFANSSSIHKLGIESKYMLEKAKSEIKSLLDIPNHDLEFTYNATEANNMAIYGIANKYKSGKIITTKIEHPSVSGPMKDLEEKGYHVVYLDILPNGIIDLEQFKKELDKDTILVAIIWVNNIIGTIQPIGEVIRLMKDYPKAKLLVDAVQGLCKTVPDFSFNDVDMFTFSAHKFYGPKGVGCLVKKNGLELAPILRGSKASKALKPGTLSLAGIVACAKAIKKYYPLTKQNEQKVIKLWHYLYDNLKNNSKIIINTPLENISPYIFNISIPSMQSETLLRLLEQHQIYVSAGSACSSKQQIPEPTIFALSKSIERATHAIRMSLSNKVELQDLEKVVAVLNTI